MREVSVDAEAGTVGVDPGVLLGELDAATQPLGLAVPAGIVTHTGVAGLTLGGGIGWLMRRHGLTADNLVEAEVVLADGAVVVTNEDERPELLWGLRGGGGNFGVVTSFRFAARHIGPVVLAGPLLFPLERAGEVLAAYGEWAAGAPREMTTILNFRKAPPASWVPDDLRGALVVVLASCWCGDLAAGGRALEPLRALGPVQDAVEPRPFVELQSFFDSSVPPGWHYYWKSVEVEDLSADVVDAIVSNTPGTSLRSYTIVFQLGGAVADLGEMDTAYPRRAAGFDININAVWLPEEAAEAETHAGWARSLFDRVEPHARGVYVNFLGDEGEDRVRDAYGAEKYGRLRGLKAAYDPTNLFSRNQNVRPASPGAS
jgi:FAD/FMN-containing dehydrogenase